MASAGDFSGDGFERSYDHVLAFIRYEGDLVENGFMDIKKSAEILYSADELLKYYFERLDPNLQHVEIEIPVRVRQGSWEIIFPDNIDEFITRGIIAWGAAKYLGSGLSEMAKNDFAGVGLKNLFRKVFRTIINIITIAKHVGTVKIRKFENLTFSEDNRLIGLPNDAGKILWTTKEAIDMYTYSPDNILSKIVRFIEQRRDLVIGVFDESKQLVEEKVTYTEKHLFEDVKDEEDDGFLFPELEHGEIVKLEGHITRGNEKENTIGFLYNDHILTCYPHSGNIKDHKTALFTNVIMEGMVKRLSIDGQIIETRPRIEYEKLYKKRKVVKQTEMFKKL
jgi:hypothetical protein